MIDFDLELKKYSKKRYKNTNIAKVKKYCVLSPGKRIRPKICFEISRHYEKNEKLLLPLAIAVENIHASSLAFDDMPFLDNSSKRRNKKSLHKKYNLILGVMGGASLVLDSIKFILESNSYSFELRNKLIQLIINNISDKGLIGSQESEKLILLKNIKSFIKMYKMKTSSLFIISTTGSSLICNASKNDIALWEKFGSYFGVIYQINNDFLDKHTKDQTMVNTFSKKIVIKYLNLYKNRCKKILIKLNCNSKYLYEIIENSK